MRAGLLTMSDTTLALILLDSDFGDGASSSAEGSLKCQNRRGPGDRRRARVESKGGGTQ